MYTDLIYLFFNFGHFLIWASIIGSDSKGKKKEKHYLAGLAPPVLTLIVQTWKETLAQQPRLIPSVFLLFQLHPQLSADIRANIAM